jgi:hypothetical protein
LDANCGAARGQTSPKDGQSGTQPQNSKPHLLMAAGELAEYGFGIELSADEGISEKVAARQLIENYSKLGVMIHKLWKEWRKL